MSRPTPFKMIADNFKKSTIYFGIAGTGLWFFWDYTITRDVMKVNCQKASLYGDERIKNPNTPIRHITVILNPVACKRKSKKLYTKWVEPLLHLAGIKVSLIETESLKQAYDLMKIMSNCDGVAIVGGDGTVHEALNGLLARPDCTKAAREIPIGIIPAGQNNSIARYIHQNNLSYRNQKEFLVESTMRLVDSVTQKFDVIKITPLEHNITSVSDGDEQTQTANNQVEPIYALRDIRYGIYQDNFYKVSGYKMYQLYVKPLWLRMKHAFATNNKYPAPKIDAISYTKPCIGCSTCYEKHRLHDSQPPKVEEPSTNRRWWSVVSPRPKSAGPTEEELKQLELSKRDNPDCQQRFKVGDVEAITDFRACMMGDMKVRLSLGRHREYSPSDVTETQDIRLQLAKEIDEEKTSRPSDDGSSEGSSDKADDNKKPVEFLIDGQPNQAHSIDVTAMDKAVTLFTGPYKIIIPQIASKRLP